MLLNISPKNREEAIDQVWRFNDSFSFLGGGRYVITCHSCHESHGGGGDSASSNRLHIKAAEALCQR